MVAVVRRPSSGGASASRGQRAQGRRRRYFFVSAAPPAFVLPPSLPLPAHPSRHPGHLPGQPDPTSLTGRRAHPPRAARAGAARSRRRRPFPPRTVACCYVHHVGLVGRCGHVGEQRCGAPAAATPSPLVGCRHPLVPLAGLNRDGGGNNHSGQLLGRCHCEQDSSYGLPFSGPVVGTATSAARGGDGAPTGLSWDLDVTRVTFQSKCFRGASCVAAGRPPLSWLASTVFVPPSLLALFHCGGGSAGLAHEPVPPATEAVFGLQRGSIRHHSSDYEWVARLGRLLCLPHGGVSEGAFSCDQWGVPVGRRQGAAHRRLARALGRDSDGFDACAVQGACLARLIEHPGATLQRPAEFRRPVRVTWSTVAAGVCSHATFITTSYT